MKDFFQAHLDPAADRLQVSGCSRRSTLNCFTNALIFQPHIKVLSSLSEVHFPLFTYVSLPKFVQRDPILDRIRRSDAWLLSQVEVANALFIPKNGIFQGALRLYVFLTLYRYTENDVLLEPSIIFSDRPQLIREINNSWCQFRCCFFIINWVNFLNRLSTPIE